MNVACVNRPCSCTISHLVLIRMALADSSKLTLLFTQEEKIQICFDVYVGTDQAPRRVKQYVCLALAGFRIPQLQARVWLVASAEELQCIE